MRTPSLACLACVTVLALAPAGRAQQATVRMKFEKVQIGFHTGAPEDAGPTLRTFKPGLWAPVYVTLVAAGDGPILLPVALDNTVQGQVRVEAPDNDGVSNVYPEPFKIGKAERIHLTAYVKPSASRAEIKVSVRPGGEGARTTDIAFYGAVEGHDSGREVNDSLYLTLGSRPPELPAALKNLANNKNDPKDTRPRYLVSETEVHRMPRRWFGYGSIDLLVLTTDNKQFLTDLLDPTHRPRLAALAGWVRRGGRLVVSVFAKHQDLAHRLLSDPKAWAPPLPDLLTTAVKEQPAVTDLSALQTWANQAGRQTPPFPVRRNEPLRIAQLKPRAEVEILAEAEGFPLIVRAPYGRGSVTVLAVDVAKAPFAEWKGAPDFWMTTLTQLAPRVLPPQRDDPGGPMRGRGEPGLDVTTRLQQELDKLGTPPLEFGWVALFVLLYILVVGPLDYLLLKKVFKRLELTWITFPAVVLGISLIAYFTAYALKGKELKVNKLDLVDLDLRSELGADLRPQRAHAYGTTWFTILSPRIQSYTVGVEPVFPRLVDGGGEAPPVVLSWLGRPETGGMGASAGQRKQSMFTRTYQYTPGAAGLKDVPIPVWTTKSFTASWEAALQKMPFEVKLEYGANDPDRQVTGSIKNNLPVDLLEVALIYRKQWYDLPSCKAGAGLRFDLQRLRVADLADKVKDWERQVPIKAADLGRWAQPRAPVDGRARPDDARELYEPGQVLKELLFFEKGDSFGHSHNHAQRRLDQSWRLPEGMGGKQEVREAILVARLAPARGPGNELNTGKDARLPTRLWLGALPGEGREPPDLAGTLTQDTYLRVFLPVTPMKR
jgi:hypothetical protein